MLRQSAARLLSSSIITAGILLVVVQPAAAQSTWQRWFGGPYWDAGGSVEPIGDGGFIAAGFTSSFGAGSLDGWLLRLDGSGETLWTRTYGGAEEDGISIVRQAPGGGYVMVGWTRSLGAGEADVWLIRVDDRGETLWTRTYGGAGYDMGTSVLPTPDSGYVIAGTTGSFGAGEGDVWLIRVDDRGETLWTRTYGGRGHDEGYTVRSTADGGYVLSGSTQSYGNGLDDFYLIRTDDRGETLWTRTWGGIDSDNGWTVLQTRDRGYIICGYTNSFPVGSANAYLVRTDSLGRTAWTRIYGNDDIQDAKSILQSPDGGYVFAGENYTGSAGYGDAWLVKTDTAGAIEWERLYGSTYGDYAACVAPTRDSGFILTGSAQPTRLGDDDLYLIKTDNMGRVAVREQSFGPRARRDSYALTVCPSVFSTVTVLRCTPPISGPAQVQVRDVAGRRVRTIRAEQWESQPRIHEGTKSESSQTPIGVVWDGNDDHGRRCPSGVYLVSLEGSFAAPARVVLLDQR